MEAKTKTEKSREPESPCAGVPIRYAHIAWTPKSYAHLERFAETAGHATVLDRRDLIAYKKNGFEHPQVNKYSSCMGACVLGWADKPIKYLILEVMAICFKLLFFDYGIDKKDVFNILYSIKETKYVFNDEFYNLFDVKGPSDEESAAYESFLDRLYGVKHGKA